MRNRSQTASVRDLLSHPWTAEELRLFFGDLPVAAWFNRTAPRVKSGEVVPERLSAAEAMPLLLADTVLIRRPLLQVGKRREAGFLAAVVDAWIGLEPVEVSSCGGLEGCGAAAGAPCGSHGAPAGEPKLTTLGRRAG